MTPLSVLDARPKSKVVKLTTNSRLYKTIIKAIQAKKGENIISLDLRKIPEAVADFFVICQASSSTQVRAISDFIEDQVKQECGENPYKQEGYQALQWVLIRLREYCSARYAAGYTQVLQAGRNVERCNCKSTRRISIKHSL